VFVLTGGGYGHGVGMSQWGALGQALAGRGYDRILATYYPGTTLGRVGGRTVRVLVAAKAVTAFFTAAGPFEVLDATGAQYPVASGGLALETGLVAPLGVDGAPVVLVPPLEVRPIAGRRLSYDGHEFRGTFEVSELPNGRLQVVNVVGLEGYLLGVVPGEMPFTWPLEALRAQAVAARTYALASLVEGEAWDLFADQRSQVYAGVVGETDATTRAVRETSGQIVLFEDRPAQTLYFSSSGGTTLSSLSVYGRDFAYLRAVADPWDSVSPNHAWEARVLSGNDLRRMLKLPAAVAEVAVLPGVAGLEPGAPGAPEMVRLTLRTGATVELRRNEVRDRLQLLSNGFRLGVLVLERPSPPASPGAAYQLRGIARDVASPRLEKLGEDGSWRFAKRLRVAEDGAFVAYLRPRATTTYRLTGSGIPGPTVTVERARA
jgi:peptidoglycan hydrolase-like amidase